MIIVQCLMQVQKLRTSVKKPATTVRSANRSVAQSQSGGKDINSSLIQRALDLVHEGQLTASVAIKLFGIPRSTFYKKLSMCSQQQHQPMSAADTETEQYYQADGDFQTDYSTEDFGNCSADVADSFVGASDNGDAVLSVGQWSNYGDYYAN